jgi:hypothetical protein
MRTLFVLTALGFSAAAIAQGLPAFEDVDQNGDGLISEAEAAIVEGLDFASADANQDGAIDPQEYSAVAQ